MNATWIRGTASGVLLAGVLAAGCAPQSNTTTSGSSAPAPPDSIGYVALGTEPFWSIKVTRAGIVFSEPGDPEGIRGEYSPPDRSGDSLTFRTVLEDGEDTAVALTLREGPCSDATSKRQYPFSAIAYVGDRVLRGCAEPSPTAHERSALSDEPELGDWVIVGQLRSGASAPADSSASPDQGSVVHLGLDRAAYGADTCLEPAYRSTEGRADSLLAAEFHATPAALGIDPAARVTVVRVHCAESRWASPGGTLVRISRDRWYAFWKGTFLELRRWDPEAGGETSPAPGPAGPSR